MKNFSSFLSSDRKTPLLSLLTMENGRHGNLAVASAAIAIPDSATPVVQLGNKAKGIYQLAYGYVQYASSMSEVANKGASTLFTAAAEPEVPEEGQEIPPDAAATAEAATKKGGGGPVFCFINWRFSKPIVLFASQAVRLIKELPQAFEAFAQKNDAYRFVVAEKDDMLVTLEVSVYNDKVYLFLKKYFKTRLEEGQPKELLKNQPWLPTKSVVSFIPTQDDPDDLFNFVLSSCH